MEIESKQKMISKARKSLTKKDEDILLIIQTIKSVFKELKKKKKGATIVIDLSNNIEDYIIKPIELEAKISFELLLTIFESSTNPLHDGCSVIRDERILYASAYIKKLYEGEEIPFHFGSRHRSALSLSSNYSCLIFCLSEETGKLTVFVNGDFETMSLRTVSSKMENLLLLEAFNQKDFKFKDFR